MSASMNRLSRRELLRRAGALSLAAPVAPFAFNLAAMGSAAAATAGDYKALVCLFMNGGNDAYNTVLATDPTSWAAYNAARNFGIEPVALGGPGTPVDPRSTAFNASLGGVLQISPAHAQGRSFALHPSLGGVRDAFSAGRVAVVANVGAIVKPMSKTDYASPSFPRPPKLFSHADQQAYWQTFGNLGDQPGWGGRLADLVLSGNQKAMFTSVSLSGNAAWLTGWQAKQFQLATSGNIHLGGDGSLFGSSVVQQKLQALARGARGSNLLEQDHAAVVARSIDADAVLSTVLPGAGAGPWGTGGLAPGAIDPLLTYRNPDTGLVEVNPMAQQLQAVARMIAARTSLGMTRQVFFVSGDDFDTHDGQPHRHAVNMARLAHAFAYFDTTMQRMGVGNQVTTFTASDFGRGFISNGSGTDHGWGGHHFVMGGAVRGGDIYGAFPVYGTPDRAGNFNSPDQVTNGAMLPTTSVDQYAATMGRWFGVSDTNLATILPNLGHFDVASRQLGFMAVA
jgi:uncharacterized protein (DUF1501 family)